LLGREGVGSTERTKKQGEYHCSVDSSLIIAMI